MFNLAIVGATGLVGSTFIKVLEERNLDIGEIYFFASERSAGKEIVFKGKAYKVILLSQDNIEVRKIDYALFSAGGKVSKQFAPIFAKNGAIVIDNSSAWRMDKNVPLVVPQVNMQDALSNSGIIANPNCSTIQCMLPLKVLDSIFSLKRVDYTTFQATSGSGMKGLLDLENTQNGKENEFYPYPIYGNVLPHIGAFLEKGFSEEEIKMVKESQKILHLPKLEVSATCVRVPIKNSHSVEIDAEFEELVDIEKAREALSVSGLILLDDVSQNIYPIPTLATGKDEVFVGRLRVDIYNPRKLHMFCVADNIRKGAATNAVEILEELLKLS